jgi:hypothetical protein
MMKQNGDLLEEQGTDYEATHGWRWVLPESNSENKDKVKTVLTKKKIMLRAALCGILSSMCYTLLSTVIPITMKTVSTSSAAVSSHQTMIRSSLFLLLNLLRPAKWIMATSAVMSFMSLTWLSFSTGGIEENSTSNMKEDR